MMILRISASIIVVLIAMIGYQAYQNEQLTSQVQTQNKQIELLSIEVNERDKQLKAAIEQQRQERRIAHQHQQKVNKIQSKLDAALDQLDKDIEAIEQQDQSNWADESLPDFAIGVLN